MSQSFNLYCDESCHLPNDGQRLMVLGVVSCPVEKVRQVAVRLREIKHSHGMSETFEVKWNKVSAARQAFYQGWVDYFFDDDDLSFRAVVAEKTGLQHEAFGQDHDTWYYKMMFQLISRVIDPNSTYRIYLDKKDTRSSRKVENLHEILCNNMYDFDRKIVERVQVVQSHEVEQLQLADLLLGAVGYENRGLAGNEGKVSLIARMKERSGYTLTRSTLMRESKFNLFHWHGRQGGTA
ncbi:MAG TPA: DUF3800 domain-containing protein [Pseudoxanthomonas sp.]|jgi:hypothetical protein|nr:DUF3800 domain-containing protein [Pseudoxanthomonas sp.]